MMNNVCIHDNGTAFMVEVNGMAVCGFYSLGDAWKHIVWMRRVASQNFTVGEKEIPVVEWIERMQYLGYLERGI